MEMRIAQALKGLMNAYQRRVRSDCAVPEQIQKQPWRCEEYVAAENALSDPENDLRERLTAAELRVRFLEQQYGRVVEALDLTTKAIEKLNSVVSP